MAAAREQNGVQKLICIALDRTVDALARLTGGRPLDNYMQFFNICLRRWYISED